MEEEKKEPKVFTLRPFQEQFFKSEAKFPAMVSGWGTGKSMVLCFKAVYLSERYPNNLGVIFRKEFVDLRDSTIKDFEQYTGLKLNASRDVVFKNGSVLMFRHLEELNNIQNINLGFAGIEQAEELENDNMFFKLFGRLRRKDVGKQQLFIIASTKGHNWIWKLWKKGELNQLPDSLKEKIEGTVAELIEATTLDNIKNLDSGFINTLEIMKLKKPNDYKRFVLNSWDDDVVVNQIIRPEDIESAIKRNLVIKPFQRVIVSCDPASEGNDETVNYLMVENSIRQQDIYSKRHEMETAGKLIIMKQKYNASVIGIDCIGIGSGIASRLFELKQPVYPIDSRESSSAPRRWRNLRAEMWDYASDCFYNNECSIPDDEVLIEELKEIRWKTVESSGCRQVESKEELKKADRLGRSPGRAESYVYGLWTIKNAKYVPINVFSGIAHRERVGSGERVRRSY